MKKLVCGACFLGSAVSLCLGVYFFATTPPVYNRGAVSQSIEQRGKDQYLVTRTKSDTITPQTSQTGIYCFVATFALVLVGGIIASDLQKGHK